MNTAGIDTEVRSIGTCKNCRTRTLHLGTVRERNGLLCPCDGTAPARFNVCKGARSAIKWSTVKATATDHECDSQCNQRQVDHLRMQVRRRESRTRTHHGDHVGQPGVMSPDGGDGSHGALSLRAK